MKYYLESSSEVFGEVKSTETVSLPSRHAGVLPKPAKTSLPRARKRR